MLSLVEAHTRAPVLEHVRTDAVAHAPDTSGMDLEPTILDCSDMAKEGKWALANCCQACHEGNKHRSSALEFDLGGGGNGGALRLRLCCKAGLSPQGGEYAKLLVEREA